MAKSKRKKAKAKKPLLRSSLLTPRAAKGAEGDLTRVRSLLQAHRAGEEGAMAAVNLMGRDAAVVALSYAQEVEDEELVAWARKLVAMPPEVKTNLTQLRERSVEAVVAHHKSAPPLEQARVQVKSAVGLFDPTLVKAVLASGGKPRLDAQARRKGVVARFGAAYAGALSVSVERGWPTGAQCLGRVRSGSGVVALGEPSASDGPRIGTVRLDPFSTGLDEALAQERVVLARLAPGTYRIWAEHPDSTSIRVWFDADPTPSEPLQEGAGVSS